MLKMLRARNIQKLKHVAQVTTVIFCVATHELLTKQCMIEVRENMTVIMIRLKAN